ncbi:hypothetical protein F5148DRAFT_257715 [Russula earlei]|uniref:Uncharacterized protein n=1 Tax=Russula earlei TaxID=71964 RepID=A0ACC0U323_9AGAM|nr:hypothetical protein F5148DRAFT_257715 [Russula earlei]
MAQSFDKAHARLIINHRLPLSRLCRAMPCHCRILLRVPAFVQGLQAPIPWRVRGGDFESRQNRLYLSHDTSYDSKPSNSRGHPVRRRRRSMYGGRGETVLPSSVDEKAWEKEATFLGLLRPPRAIGIWAFWHLWVTCPPRTCQSKLQLPPFSFPVVSFRNQGNHGQRIFPKAGWLGLRTARSNVDGWNCVSQVSCSSRSPKTSQGSG